MTHDQRTIHTGLIGYGFADKTFHAPLIRSVAGLLLTAVSTSRTDTVRADLPDAVVMTPEELIARPEIDLVVIASPNESHYPSDLAFNASRSIAGWH